MSRSRRSSAKIRQHFDDHPDLKRTPRPADVDSGNRRNNSWYSDPLGDPASRIALNPPRRSPHLPDSSPRERRSGTSIHGRPRLCKTGNARIRKALYMPAMVAASLQPDLLRIFAERLAARRQTQTAHHRSRHAKAAGACLRDSAVRASLSMPITLDAEYGIYPGTVTAISTSPHDRGGDGLHWIARLESETQETCAA